MQHGDAKNRDLQRMAAMVLFKDLHAKMVDIYDVLAEFIKEIIIENGLVDFTCDDILNLLINQVGFKEIPRKVIQASIGRIDNVTKSRGKYIVSARFDNSRVTSLLSAIEEKRQFNDEIIKDVCNYISEHRAISLDDKEIKRISDEFCAYLFDEHNSGEYIPEIAAYLVELKNNDYKKRIDDITQGIYQYAALTYNEDISKIDSLKNNLTLIFDTDILLSLGGFHGEIFKRYIEDIILLVNEVNSKSGKKFIKLRYFNYTWGEVEDVFSSAKFYVRGSNDYIREAAKSIASGCTSIEDIIVKKSAFESMLKSKGILKLDFDDAYDDKYVSYNLEGDKTLDDLLSEDCTKEDIEKASKRASDIHKLRNGRIRKNFEDTEYILISDNRNIGYIASVISKNNSSYFYVMDCGKITNVLWQKMNKGLSTSIIPASMNIITKSQVVLSSYTTRKMHCEINSLEQKLERGDITHETMVAAIYHFKEIASKPEEITAETIERNLSYIEQEVEDYGEELSYYKNALIEKDEDNLINEERHKAYVQKVNARERLRNEAKLLESYINNADNNKGKIDNICFGVKCLLMFAEILLFIMILVLYWYLVNVRKVYWVLFASTNNFIFWITGVIISAIAPGIGVNKNKKIINTIRIYCERKYDFSSTDYETSKGKKKAINEQLKKLDEEIMVG